MYVSQSPARAPRALGLLLADSVPTVGWGKTFWCVSRFFFTKTAVTQKRKVAKPIRGYLREYGRLRQLIEKLYRVAKDKYDEDGNYEKFKKVYKGEAYNSKMSVLPSAATLCRDNCQLIGEPINRTRSAGKKNRN